MQQQQNNSQVNTKKKVLRLEAKEFQLEENPIKIVDIKAEPFFVEQLSSAVAQPQQQESASLEPPAQLKQQKKKKPKKKKNAQQQQQPQDSQQNNQEQKPANIPKNSQKQEPKLLSWNRDLLSNKQINEIKRNIRQQKAMINNNKSNSLEQQKQQSQFKLFSEDNWDEYADQKNEDEEEWSEIDQWNRPVLTVQQLEYKKQRDKERVRFMEERVRQVQLADEERARKEQEDSRLKSLRKERFRQKKRARRIQFSKNLVKVQQEIQKIRRERGLYKEKQKNIRYKAVPADTLDFEPQIKEKKKKSHIKTALKKFLDESKNNEESEHLTLPAKTKLLQKKQKMQADDGFETVAECSENEEHVIKLKNNLYTVSENGLVLPVPENQLANTLYNHMLIRPWVDHVPCQEIDNKVLELVNFLAFQQAKKKIYEPLKYKRRVISGLKECTKSLQLNSMRSRCIILAINLQQNPGAGGSDQHILKILELCKQKNILIIHASSRNKLGRAFTGKFGPKISCLSLLNYEGSEERFENLKELVYRKRKEFLDVYCL